MTGDPRSFTMATGACRLPVGWFGAPLTSGWVFLQLPGMAPVGGVGSGLSSQGKGDKASMWFLPSRCNRSRGAFIHFRKKASPSVLTPSHTLVLLSPKFPFLSGVLGPGAWGQGGHPSLKLCVKLPVGPDSVLPALPVSVLLPPLSLLPLSLLCLLFS